MRSRSGMRVWSVIVTIFGDAVLPRGGTVSAETLRELCARMNIEPGALRTALSRLVKDGWIEREMRGRNSFYRLRNEAAQAARQASRRIYAAAPLSGPDNWMLVLGEGGNGADNARASMLADAGFIQMGSALSIGPDSALPDAGADLLIAAGNIAAMPGWARDKLYPASVADAYNQVLSLCADLEMIDAAPIDAAVARTILIHEWRRPLLRHREWGVTAQPAGWPQEICRRAVAQRYIALSAQADAWFDGRPELAAAPRDIENRFRR